MLCLLLLLCSLSVNLGINVGTRSGGQGAVRQGQGDSAPLQPLNIGLILPQSLFNRRKYTGAIKKAVDEIVDAKIYNFLDKYRFTEDQIHYRMMELKPSPTGG